MQRNQRPPPKGGNVPSQYDWHSQGSRDAAVGQNYSAHQLSNHQQQNRNASSSSRSLHHNIPPGHSAPLLPLPQGYPPPPAAAMQGSSAHHGGQGSGSGQNFSPAHYPPREQQQQQQQQQHQQQVNLGDLSASTTSLEDLAKRVKALGFPASCNFVLGLLERYFSSQLDSAKNSSAPPQLAQEKITGLIDMFIINIDRPLTTPPGATRGGALPALNPVKEMQLLLILHAQLQDQANLELRYCIFDALFGGEPTSGSEKFLLMSKLISLSITLVSEGVLLCAAMWMKAHPPLAFSLVKSLFYEFCVLLPNALDPLLGVADHSPLLAYHMIAVFTTLYPLHIVGKQLPEVDPAHLHPPLTILRLVLHWVECKPELFCRPRNHDLELSKLPLLSHTHSSPSPSSHSHSSPSPAPASTSLCSPITGIIQWCILAPMVDDKQLYSNEKENSKCTNSSSPTASSHPRDILKSSNSIESPPTNSEGNFQSLLARLHAELLSALLSHGQVSPPHPAPLIDGLSSDDVAVLVASLIAYGRKVGVAGGGVMEESVERFAQFLQISMSAKMLQLKPEDIKFIASTLPRNRLLELVITHTK